MTTNHTRKSGHSAPTRKRLHVLVVDDSAVVRQVTTALLSNQPGISVSVAADPFIAMSKMKQARPDVILLDLEMPRMDGLTFLRKIMSEDPIPVVVCSGLAGEGTEAAMRALEEGAVDIVTKPKLGVKGFLEESVAMLVDTLRAASQARPGVRKRRVCQPVAPVLATEKHLLTLTTSKVVAIGTSTGGTEALRSILEVMPPDCPGIVIVQHMPEHFTAAFARRLNEVCRIEVKEAANGDRVLEGRALVAPGNHHLTLHRDGAHYVVRVSQGEMVSRHRPSVNVLFHSVARAAGPNAVGVILTGMGDDGAEGMLDMKGEGASTIAQDEKTSVVFGMPKEAIIRGAVDEVLPLPLIPALILKRAWASVPKPEGQPRRDNRA
jgi:two-component system chemotaxis response regulator CheB